MKKPTNPTQPNPLFLFHFRLALKQANEQLDAANTKLAIVMKNVGELEAKLAVLTSELAEANAIKKKAMDDVAKGESKLNLAQRLTNALASENERWGVNVVVMKDDAKLLTGDVLLASAFISYIGPFTKPFRTKLMDDEFLPFLQREFKAAAGEGGKVPMSDAPDVLKILTTPAEVAGWNADQLPADIVSSENGSIVCNSSRWPLLIDPQLQGIAWIRNRESGADRDLQIVRLGQKDLIRKLEKALDRGTTILIENLGETLEAVLNPVIQRATIKRGSKFFIKVGDKECDFHPNFKLYLHTKLGNPHYPPEIQAECTLVNFTVTLEGLEDQLLTKVVAKERPDLASLSEELVSQQNGFTIKVKELEDNILNKLKEAEGDITEDVELIEGLEETKRISLDIEEKSRVSKETQAQIFITSEKYRSVANRSSLLFFLMNDLVKVHTYYIYSLAAFSGVFFRGIDLVKEVVPEKEEGEEEDDEEEKVEKTDEELAARCIVLIDSITTTVFNYVRRGLFVVDKLTVATLLTLKILVNDGLMKQEDVDMLVMGKIHTDPGNMGPLHEWLPDSIWPKIKSLETMACFKGLGDNMQSDSDDWSAWFDVEKAEQAKLPGEYEKSLDTFQKLTLLRAIRPDRVSNGLTNFIGQTMGKKYVTEKPFDMAQTYAETTPATPVFFVLFAGVDPTPNVENLGKTFGITLENKNFINISMGQGQEPYAEAVVER
jgi:dynein heavy chain